MKGAVKLRNMEYVDGDKKLLELAVFIGDSDTKMQLEQGLGRLKFRKVEIFTGDVRSATKKYKKIPSPELLIVDISASDLPLTDLQDLANVCSPDVRVVVIGNRDNVGLYRNLLSQGVSEYLVKPIPTDLLYRALEKILGPVGGALPNPKVGKAVGIYGASGGIGSTTILSNLADILSSEMHRRIMLVDLNLHRGDLGLQLGQGSNKGLSELLASPERMDGLFIERTVTSISSRLDLLSADENWEAEINVSPNVVNELTENLRQHYHFVLCDVMGSPVPQALRIFESMDVRILLLSPSLAALRNSKKILDGLDRGNSDAQTLVVLNNSRPVFKSDLDPKKIEQFIGRAIDFQIPYDGKSFSVAALHAIPVSRKRRKAAYHIRKLAWSLVGQGQKKKSRSYWKNITVRGRDVW